MPRTLLVLLLCVIASGCYHSVPTREPGREIWKLRYTSGVEIEFPRRHRAYWQDSVVVVEQHAGDEQPRIIPASDIEETWAREIQGGETKFLTGLIAGVLVLVLFVTGLQAPT